MNQRLRSSFASVRRSQRRIVIQMCLVLVFAGADASATPFSIATLDDRPFLGLSGSGLTVGMEFILLAPMTVVEFGWYDFGQDGLAVSHEIGLWAGGFLDSGPPLVTAIVSAGTTAPLLDVWRTVDVPDLTLLPGTYMIAGLDPLNSTDALNQAPVSTGAVQLDSRIFFGQPVASFLPGFARPEQNILTDGGIFGPTLIVVPEPGTLALLAAGLVGVAAATRRNERHSGQR